jgi:hypothetical protein
MIIEVELKTKNGKAKKEKFILDTGAPTSLMESYANRESFKRKESSMNQVAVGDGAKQVSNDMLQEPLIFKLGDIEILQKHTLVNRGTPADFDCTGAVGLIGSNMLSKFVVSLDFAHNTLTLINKDEADRIKISGYNYKLSFFPLFFQNNPLVSIVVNNEEYSGVFDTGFSGDIMLTTDSTDDKLKIRTDGGKIRQFETYAAISNIRGILKTQGTCWSWPKATITNEDKKPLATGNISILKTGKQKLDFTMGIDYMRQFDRIVIDWKSNNIYFFNKAETKPDTSAATEVRIRHLADEQKYVVGLIDVESSYYKAGLRAGDVVSKVGNTNVAEIGKTGECTVSEELNRLCKDANSYAITREGKEVVINKTN